MSLSRGSNVLVNTQIRSNMRTPNNILRSVEIGDPNAVQSMRHVGAEGYPSNRPLHTSAYVGISQHTPAYVGIRKHTLVPKAIQATGPCRMYMYIHKYIYVPSAIQATGPCFRIYVSISMYVCMYVCMYVSI